MRTGPAPLAGGEEKMEELPFRYSVVGRAEDGRVIIVLLDGDPPERCGLFRCDVQAARRMVMGLMDALMD